MKNGSTTRKINHSIDKRQNQTRIDKKMGLLDLPAYKMRIPIDMWYVPILCYFLHQNVFLQFPLNWFRAIFVPFKGQRFRPFWFLLKCSAWDFSFNSVQNAITTHLYYELKILYPPLCNEKQTTAACITYLLFSVIRTITRGAFLNYLDPSRQFSTEFSMKSSSSIKTMGNH